MNSTLAGNITINGHGPFRGTITVTQDVEYVRSYSAVMADPTWEYTDAAGHWHAFAAGDKGKRWELPTLYERSEQAPCDGSCGGVCQGEGYTIVRRFCRACDEEIEPRFIPDEQAQTVGTPVYGLKDWTLTLHDWPFEQLDTPSRQKVVVRLVAAETVVFGVAQVADYHITRGTDWQDIRVVLAGIGPLGEQLPRPIVVA